MTKRNGNRKTLTVFRDSFVMMLALLFRGFLAMCGYSSDCEKEVFRMGRTAAVRPVRSHRTRQS